MAFLKKKRFVLFIFCCALCAFKAFFLVASVLLSCSAFATVQLN